MRKLLLLSFLIIAVIAHARQISEGEAASIASEFLNSATVRQASAKVGVRRVKAQNAANAEAAPFYVYNADDNQGFVIISGDDRANKILGYSNKGNFDYDNMPPQLNAMLEQYEEQIKNIPANIATHESWKASTRVSEEGGVLLETANWGQGAPYNSLCPIIDGVQAPTGCVATAMAIVMKYHNWPEGYDWNSMPKEDVSASNSSEIAALMKTVGESVLMHYSSIEGSANMNFVGHRFQQQFKYSPECQFITAKNFTDDVWVSMLKSNLDNGNPVIYNGTGSGSHAFIIDGYDNNDLYHVNWGWEGLYNGMYALNALTPGSDNFSDNAGMVINIMPDKSGKQYSNVFCDNGYFWATGGLAAGSHFSINSPAKNQEFDYTCLSITYPCDESGQIGLLLFDKNGDVKEVLKSLAFNESRDDTGWGIWGNDLAFHKISVSSEIGTDDYFALGTRKKTSDPWLEVLGTIEGPVRSKVVDIKKDVSTISIINETKWYVSLHIGEWIDLGNSNNSIEVVRGESIGVSVLDENGNKPEDCTISIKGTGVYGDITVFHGGDAALISYGGDYTLQIENTKADINKVVELTEAGTLNEALKDIEISKLGSLTVSGFINANDLWYIRDNAKSINTINLQNAKIVACEATDPVKEFQISGSEQTEDALPTYALTGLQKLADLTLPRNLASIGSNSMMALAISRIDLPSSVQYMGLNVFFDCENLQTVVCSMTNPVNINECVFTSTKCPSKGVLYVPSGSLDSYSNTAVWQDFAQIIEDDNPPLESDVITYEGLKYRIHGKALYLVGFNQSQLPEDVVMPESIVVNGYECKVLGIDDNAMENSQIRSFVMANTITSIGSNVFFKSSVVKISMSDNIKYLPFLCINGDYIEELRLPENAESICNSIYCSQLKKLHLPKKLKSEIGYNGSIGANFQSIEEITVDPENEEWSIHNGILYWKGLSHLSLVPNTMSGEISIPDETTDINAIQYCNNITKITFGDGVKSLRFWGNIYQCENLRHIDFNNNILFSSSWLVNTLNSLESFTIRDFMCSSDNCFCYLPSLKYVYLLNENPVDFGGAFYYEVNPSHDYFTSSLKPQVTVPDGSKIFVAGGVKDQMQTRSNSNLEEMWKYEIDRANGMIKVEPLIDGVVIDGVSVNGDYQKVNTDGIYYFDAVTYSGLNVDVEYTLHDRQPMTTHYDAQFNAAVPDADLTTGVNDITVDTENINDVYNIQGICIRRNATQADIDALPAGIYIINGRKVVVN